MDQDSRLLVDQAAGGDAGAIDALLVRHLPGLRAFIRLRAGQVLRNEESVSDLAQSVCREILTHLDRYQYRGEKEFRNWLYTTAFRKIAHRHSYYMAAKRVPPQSVPRGHGAEDAGILDIYHTLCTPSRDAIAREEMACVEGAFDRLPDDYRKVIVLARIVGLSGAELAAEMGRSEVATRKLLSRALAALAKMLEA